MLEEVSMEKKTPNRSGQAPLKGNGTELKKPQDVQPNGKQIPRGCRKREPAPSNGFKFEQNRKPAPQKSKAIDKRPQSRGFYNGGGKENTQVREDHDDTESGLLFYSGRKKLNLNHLLNFHYEPRGEAAQAVRKNYSRSFSTKSLMATQTHKYNKEQFLQANCQFIVRLGEDYTPYLGNPDILVDWDLVEMIRVWSSEVVTCPICLYPPVAAKITRCGHVFCWSCALHYLALSDRTWRKCPICNEAVHKNDLKSVECINNKSWNVSHKIEMRLMKRERGSTVASPVSQYEPRTVKPLLQITEGTLDTVYSKLLLASKSDVMNIIDREKKELNEQLEECKDQPELCFVEEAKDLLFQREKKLDGPDEKQETDTSVLIGKIPPESIEMGKYEDDVAIGEAESPTKELQSPEELPSERERYESMSSEGEENTNVTAEDLYISTNQVTNQPAKHFYFYQAIDGQQIYLHAINVRMLEMQYGSLEHCPPIICGTIVEKEAGSMTQELRRRLRYMQHVPITCQFEVVEIHLAPPTISKDVLDHFRDQLEQRKHVRAKRARAERRRERKIEVDVFGHTRDPKLRIESLHHFPQCGVDLPPQPPSPQVGSRESSRASSPLSVQNRASPISCAMAALSVEEHPSASPNSTEESGPSFAQMLREGKTMKATGMAWPTVGDSGRSGGRQHQVSLTESDSESATAFSPPAKHSFSIAEVLQNACAQGPLETNAGRKKKKKQKVLFSTGMACTGK